jgi:hypothetical protein
MTGENQNEHRFIEKIGVTIPRFELSASEFLKKLIFKHHL